MRPDASQRRYQHDDRGDRYSGRGLNGRSSEYAPWVKYAVLAVILLVAVVAGLSFKTCTASQAGDAGSSAASVDAKSSSRSGSSKKSSKKAATSKNELDGIPTGQSVQTFSLNGGKAPVCNHGEFAMLKTLISQAEESGDVGIVFYDLSSGKGVTYNADAEVYGASGFKAPYALYICEALVETGQVKLDKPLSTYDKDSTMGDMTVRELIEASIINSDNDSFIALREAFNDMGFEDWATALDAEEAQPTDGGEFPTYCARTSAKLWKEMSAYLSTDSETSRWLSRQLSSTEMSFIRAGIQSDEANVFDKAGWIDEQGYEATCDSGLIQIDGRTYVMSIMTSMPWSDASSDLVEQMANELFAARATFA